MQHSIIFSRKKDKSIMKKGHRVIIGPGLDGKTEGLRFITRKWENKYRLTPTVIKITWKDEGSFDSKLNEVLQLIDRFVAHGDSVSLVGCSASGSLMLNSFVKRKKVINKVINICGFLRIGNGKGTHSFEVRSRLSNAFRESVTNFEKVEPGLTEEDRKKILTVSSMFGDELVPVNTVTIKGAVNEKVPMIEHVASIATALTLYNPVIAFLKN
jgi:hypothetical protein